MAGERRETGAACVRLGRQPYWQKNRHSQAVVQRSAQVHYGLALRSRSRFRFSEGVVRLLSNEEGKMHRGKVYEWGAFFAVGQWHTSALTISVMRVARWEMRCACTGCGMPAAPWSDQLVER